MTKHCQLRLDLLNNVVALLLVHFKLSEEFGFYRLELILLLVLLILESFL